MRYEQRKETKVIHCQPVLQSTLFLEFINLLKVRDSDIEDNFKEFGKIVEIKVREGRDRDKFAFVEYEDMKSAEEALEK